jgi:hypothetical protein
MEPPEARALKREVAMASILMIFVVILISGLMLWMALIMAYFFITLILVMIMLMVRVLRGERKKAAIWLAAAVLALVIGISTVANGPSPPGGTAPRPHQGPSAPGPHNDDQSSGSATGSGAGTSSAGFSRRASDPASASPSLKGSDSMEIITPLCSTFLFFGLIMMVISLFTPRTAWFSKKKSRGRGVLTWLTVVILALAVGLATGAGGRAGTSLEIKAPTAP